MDLIKGQRRILAGVSLAIGSGEVLGLIGPNGAGKSSLVRLMAALEAPTKGRVLLAGELLAADGSCKATPKTRRLLGIVLQNSLLLRGTVYHNVALGLRLRHTPRAQERQRVEAWLTRLGLEALAGRKVSTLSGGEAQRVALARAMVLQPELLLLDEPFAAMDAPSRVEFISQLGEILAETNTAAVVVSHDFRDLFPAQRIAVLLEGRLAQLGTQAEVLLHPGSQELACFVGMENRWPGELRAAAKGELELVLASGRVVIALDGGSLKGLNTGDLCGGRGVLACLRPEEVELVNLPSARERQAGTAAGAQWWLARVLRAGLAGGMVRVEAAWAGGRLVAALPPQRGLLVRPGMEVYFRLPGKGLHLIPVY